MPWLAALAIGLLAGGAAVEWAARRRQRHWSETLNAERDGRAQAQAQWSAAESRLAEARQQYESRLQESAAGEDRLRTQLQALLPQVAQQVLGTTSAQLTDLARRDLQAIGEQTRHAVGQSNADLRQSVEQMQQQMQQYQQRIHQLETERAAAAARLEQQIVNLQSTGLDMSQEARRLREALESGNSVRGNWGELELKNIFDSCGLTEGRDYALQYTIEYQGKKQRLDAVISLPSGRRLIIDSKASMKPFFDALALPDAEQQRELLRSQAKALKQHADELAEKQYSRHLDNSLPCVIMFVPSEAVYRAAVQADAALFAYGTELKPDPMILATPLTLMPLILTIAYGWREQQITREAKQLHTELEIFLDRLKVYVEHVDKIGSGLATAVTAYEKSRGSYSQRLLPQMQKIEALGADISAVPEPRALPPATSALPAAGVEAARAAGESE